MISIKAIIAADFIIKKIVNYCLLQETIAVMYLTLFQNSSKNLTFLMQVFH